MRAFFLSLLLLFSTLPADAQHNIFIATGHGGIFTPPPSACPFPVDNGCTGSIAGQAGSAAVLYTTARQSPATNMINLLTASPTDYSVTGPQVNMPAIDYWVGEPFPLSSLKDPTNPANLPAGCTLGATGPGSNPVVSCTVSGTSNLLWDSFDMTVGGTSCVAHNIGGTSTGTATVTNNNWKNNGNCAVAVFDPVMFSASTMVSGNLVFMYNTLDGNGVTWPYDYGSCAPPTGTATPQCNPAEAFLMVGGADVEYNAILNFTGRTLQYQPKDVTKLFTFKHNLLQGCCSSNPAAHGEFEEYGGNPGGAGEIFDSNTVLATTAHHDSGQAAFPLQFTTMNAIPIFDISNNFYVPGSSGGASVLGPTIAGSMSGNILTTTSITTGRTLGSGALITCGTAPNQTTGMLVYDGTNTGVVSAGPAGGGNSNGNNATTWPMTWGAAGISAYIDNGSGAAGNTMTVTADPNMILQVGSGAAVNGARFITAMSPSTNPDTGVAYTGTGQTGTYGVGGAAAVLHPTYTGSLSGNTLTITGSITQGAVATGQIITGAGISGQPVITAGSGLSWTFNGSAQTVGLETMQNVLQVSASPDNIFPGGWGTPTGLTPCSNGSSGIPFTRAFADETQPGGGATGPIGQVTHQGNYYDGWVYGPGATGHLWSQRTNSETFNGTIVGTALTINSGTPPVLGQGILSTSGVAAGTEVISGTTPNFVVSISQSIGPISMTATQTWCSNPTIWGTSTGNPNVDMAGLNTITQMNQYGSENIPGNNCQ